MGGLEPQETGAPLLWENDSFWLLSFLKPQQMLTNAFTIPLSHCPEETASQSHCRPFFFSAQVNTCIFFFFFKDFIFRPGWVFTAACGLSQVAVCRSYTPAVVQRLLIAVASLAEEHRL